MIFYICNYKLFCLLILFYQLSAAIIYRISPSHLIKQNIALFNGKFDYSKIEDCEHRYFHLMAINKNQARIRISPYIIFPEDNVW